MSHTFVLIPGLLSDRRVWTPLARALGEDRVHHADVTTQPTIEAMASDLLSRTTGPLVVVGHSMGGRVAMDMARQAPDRVRALVLANTGHNALQPGELPKREAKIAKGHADMAAMVAEWLPPMVAPTRHDDAALMADLTEMSMGIGPDVHERQIRALVARPDAAQYLPSVRCPVFLITGEQDGWSPEQQHREIAALVPGSEVVVVEGAGHFLPVERPDETVAAVTDWLNRHKDQI